MSNESYEQRCRALLRAYPRRYREVREEELLGTLLDVANPDLAVPSFGDSWDIVRGGLAARLHARPPALSWLAYRLWDGQVPVEYRYWVRDDVFGRLHYLRRRLGRLGLTFGMMALTYTGMYAMGRLEGDVHDFPVPVLLASGGWIWYWVLIALLTLTPIPPLDRRIRQRILMRHELALDGTTYDHENPWPIGPLEKPLS
jgi:hypothetical protein